MKKGKRLLLYKSRVIEVLTFACLFYFYLQFAQLPDPTYGDESILLNGAYRILQGEVIYKDFAEYIAPLPFYTLAGLFKIFGTKLLVARIFNSLCMLINSIFIYLILRNITRNIIISISGTVTFSILGYSFWYITSHHWLLLSLELAVIYLLVMFLEKNKQVYIILSGLLTSFTPFAIQHKGGLFMIGVTVWILLIYYFYLKDKYLVLSYLMSLLILPVIFLLYLIASDNLLPMMYNIAGMSAMGYYLSNFLTLPHYFFTGKNAILLFLENVSTTDITGSVHMIFKIIFYIFLGYLPFICLPMFFARIFLEWRKLLVKDNRFYKKILFFIIGIMTFSGIFIGRSDQYQLITIFPFQIFLVFFLLEDMKKIKPIANMLLFLLTTGALIYGVENVIDIEKRYVYSVTAPTGDVLYYKDKDLAEDLQNFYNYSATNIKEDNLVAIYWGDKFYFYLQKKNPLYFNLYLPVYSEAKELHDISVNFLNKMISRIGEIKPQHIIWDRYGTRGWDYAAYPNMLPQAEKFVNNPLIDYIKEHYNVAVFFPVANIVVYKRK